MGSNYTLERRLTGKHGAVDQGWAQNGGELTGCHLEATMGQRAVSC